MAFRITAFSAGARTFSIGQCLSKAARPRFVIAPLLFGACVEMIMCLDLSG